MIELEKIRALFDQLTSLEFWESALAAFKSLGIAFPIVLSAIESLVPPLPLVVIVALNVAAYGPFLGAFYSWVGTCLGCTIVFFFFRKLFQGFFSRLAGGHRRIARARKWVDGVNGPALFLIAVMPFTPSAFLNFAFGVSDYNSRKYLTILFSAKLIMVSLLALLGQSMITALQQPWIILLVAALFLVLYYFSAIVTKRTKIKEDRAKAKSAEQNKKDDKEQEPKKDEIGEKPGGESNSEK